MKIFLKNVHTQYSNVKLLKLNYFAVRITHACSSENDITVELFSASTQI